MKYFGIKDWKVLQHYSNRRPTWLKWYNECIEPGTVLHSMSDEMVGQYSKIMALACKSDNSIPYNPEVVAEEIHASSPVDLDAFAELGLLVVAEGREALAVLEQKRMAKIKKDKGHTKGTSKNASKKSIKDASKNASKNICKNACLREQRSESESDTDTERERIDAHPPTHGAQENPEESPATQRQVSFARSVLRKAGITLEQWKAEKEISGAITSEQVDEILASQSQVNDPKKFEKEIAETRNTLLRQLTTVFHQSGEEEARGWITGHPDYKGHLNRHLDFIMAD